MPRTHVFFPSFLPSSFLSFFHPSLHPLSTTSQRRPFLHASSVSSSPLLLLLFFSSSSLPYFFIYFFFISWRCSWSPREGTRDTCKCASTPRLHPRAPPNRCVHCSHGGGLVCFDETPISEWKERGRKLCPFGISRLRHARKESNFFSFPSSRNSSSLVRDEYRWSLNERLKEGGSVVEIIWNSEFARKQFKCNKYR